MILLVVSPVKQVLHLYYGSQESVLKDQNLGNFSVRAGRLTYLLCSDREEGEAYRLVVDIFPTIAVVIGWRAYPSRTDILFSLLLPWSS